MSQEIRLNSQPNTTQISNEFIDRFMVDANGEYVKVYLYLLRCINSNPDNLSISSIADHLDNTEKDVNRALKYWEKMSLLQLEYDGKTLMSINILDIPEAEENKDKQEETITLRRGIRSKVKEAKTQAKPSSNLSPAVLKDLYYSIEYYFKRTLSTSDQSIIDYFLNELSWSPELVEYLITYCLDNGYNNMKAIQKIGLEWDKEGVTSKEDAERIAIFHSKTYYAVINSFGITNRRLNDLELHFLNRWTKEYHYGEEIISEACNRTIVSTNQPNFKYADKILEHWFKNKAKTLDDVKRLDDAHKAESVKVSKSKTRLTSSAKDYNNFTQRKYDAESLERELLGIAKI